MAQDGQHHHDLPFPPRNQFEIMAELSGRSGPMLDIHKNPLLVSILTSCEMLKALDAKGELPLNHIINSRALLFMKADKVSVW